MSNLTQAELKSLVSYNSRTGIFKWLHSGPGRNESLLAGSINTQGYRVVRICGEDYFAHRLAFLYVTGSWPVHTIDHRNGVRRDNRWTNLRDVTHTGNMRNCSKAIRNAISRGVSWDAARHKYKAQLYADGRVRLNKRFDDLADAQAAYAEAKRIYHTIQ